MKIIFVMALVAGSVYGQSAAATTTAPAATSATTVRSKKTKVPTAPLTIPKTAVDQGDGSFRYVDPKGTAWIYRQTPFGVSRSLESTVSAQATGKTPFGQSKSQAAAIAAVTTAQASGKDSDDINAKVTAVAQGDTIEFSRPTPFGVTKWQKNKNDLTPDEQKIWERVQPKGSQQK
jgi:hypothetical protein